MATEPWHLKKEIPITLIVALLIQAGASIYWGAELHHQVLSNSADIERLKAWETDHATLDSRQDSRLASVETGMGAQLATLQRIEDKLDAIMLERAYGKRK